LGFVEDKSSREPVKQ